MKIVVGDYSVLEMMRQLVRLDTLPMHQEILIEHLDRLTAARSLKGARLSLSPAAPAIKSGTPFSLAIFDGFRDWGEEPPAPVKIEVEPAKPANRHARRVEASRQRRRRKRGA
jgi:hypothetical protein